ncbi:family 43 glycosylhydrolase [Streptomyces muensis]|uniref:Family 43 glycosylhydrolase n=1 Tax=Streptomyces muensis TaxID=1077944 RepID=A0A9X1PRU1_STRM4|nr:family 43 glycosylhydrolase [Streptomyces muensis]MCF1592350.1 family 43 glycosylhydrolase [Streptomyces muensis]
MSQQLVTSGVPWFDDRGQTVNAHGACLLQHDGRYYLFGEYKTDDLNRFAGFSCYSSADLVNWRFEKLVLPQQPDGLMGPGRVGERVKVMRCPSTGRYVMYMHSDDPGYMDPHICVAVSDTIDGEYTFLGELTHRGEPIRKWDVGTFQDDDGTGYLLLHEGDIFRLSQDYLTAEEQVAHEIARGGESPAMLKHGDTYFLMFSHKTSWESNENFHLSAPAIEGPWTYRGFFAPDGSLTCNSQCTYAFKISTAGGDVPVYMGDRWSFPHQASAATYVWLPLHVDGNTLAIEQFWGAWNPLTCRPAEFTGKETDVGFSSDTAGDSVELPFTGSRIILVGQSRPDGSYARVELIDADGAVISSIYVTFYSKVPDYGYRYASPVVPHGEYTLKVSVTGDVTEWSDKRGEHFGSVGTRVAVDRAVVID